ncbi:MAG: YfhO family protein [Bacteroidia bacterium]|nr:YfhO family protein [Bacteroidia bacterium]
MVLILFAVSLVLTAIYLYPNFSGKVLNQSDVVQAEGGQTEVKKYMKEEGKQILWTNSMFSGMPTYQVYLEHKNNLVKRFILNPITQNLPSPFSIFFLCLVSGFLFFYALKFKPWVNLIATLVFTYSCFNIVSIEAGHLNKILALALMPAIWAGAVLIFDKKVIAGSVVSLIAVAMQLGFNHPQITYYTFLGLGIYFLYQIVLAIQSKQFKSVLIAASVMILSVGLSIGSNASLLWTTYEYADETIRGGSELSDAPNSGQSGLDKGYAFSWSYGIGESIDLIIPNAYGGRSAEELSKNSETYKAMIAHGIDRRGADNFIKGAPTYWGDQPFTGGPAYMGVIAFLFFLYFMIAGRSSQRWWLLGIFVFSMLLSWGRHLGVFSDLMFSYFPMYNKFRTPLMAMSLTLLCVAAGAGFGIMALIENLKKDPEKEGKRFFIIAGILGGICLLIALAPALFFSFQNEQVDESIKSMIGGEQWLLDAIQSDRASLARMDALRSFVLIALSAGMVFLLNRNILKPQIFTAVLALLVVFDMIGVDARYMAPGDFKPRKTLTASASQADRLIMQDPDIHYRVFDVTRGPFADAMPSLFHKSIGGYHAAKIRRYQDVIERHISKNNMAVLDMLNAKYIIVSGETPDAPPQVMPNPDALGNAWFVSNFKWAPTPDDEINGLTGLNPRTTAVISEKDKAYLSDVQTTPDSTATIKLVSYHPDRMKYESMSNAQRLAVFSEIYYNSGKGWEAYIDGQKTDHIRVNYILRALKVPAGKHNIEFVFEPKSFREGSRISLMSSILVLTLALGGIGFLVYQSRKKSPQA